MTDDPALTAAIEKCRARLPAGWVLVFIEVPTPQGDYGAAAGLEGTNKHLEARGATPAEAVSNLADRFLE